MSRHARHQAMLVEALGPMIRDALATPGTTEVMVNADGTVWHEVQGQSMRQIGTQESQVTAATIYLVATLNGEAIHRDRPSLAGVLPGGQRFQGFLPPRSKAPAYCIRVPSTQILAREQWVPHGCPAAAWDILVTAIQQRQTVLLVGRMSSGKTTLMNSLMAWIPPHVRVVTMEDTMELIIDVPNHLQLYGRDATELQGVIKDGFRTNAHQIPVGEIRDGATALQALNVWMAMGGGLGTLHAASARHALFRLNHLCGQVTPGTYQPMIGEVIDYIAYLDNVGGIRQVTELIHVERWNDTTHDYRTTDCLATAGVGPAPAGVGTPCPSV